MEKQTLKYLSVWGNKTRRSNIPFLIFLRENIDKFAALIFANEEGGGGVQFSGRRMP
jgi:hypothetical protein